MVQSRIDRSTIVVRLGHERDETAQIDLQADLVMNERALARISPHEGDAEPYKPVVKTTALLKGVCAPDSVLR